jgi:hypothetical protein
VLSVPASVKAQIKSTKYNGALLSGLGTEIGRSIKGGIGGRLWPELGPHTGRQFAFIAGAIFNVG